MLLETKELDEMLTFMKPLHRKIRCSDRVEAAPLATSTCKVPTTLGASAALPATRPKFGHPANLKSSYQFTLIQYQHACEHWSLMSLEARSWTQLLFCFGVAPQFGRLRRWSTGQLRSPLTRPGASWVRELRVSKQLVCAQHSDISELFQTCSMEYLVLLRSSSAKDSLQC